MNKQIKPTLFLLLFLMRISFLCCQNSAPISFPVAISENKNLDAIADYINNNFDGSDEKLTAIYNWIAQNIAYDVLKSLTINQNENTMYDKNASIQNTLNVRKGVCQDYTELMEALCKKCDIEGYFISGFVQKKDSVIEPHAWFISFVENDWQIHDPTWGAGYVNDGIFTARFSYDFFKISPVIAIQQRMPHDLMWQLLLHPVDVERFYSGIFSGDSAKLFYYRDSLADYRQQDSMTRYKNILRRVETQGIYNQATADYVLFLKNEIENDKINAFNKGVKFFNRAVDQSNTYSHYFNRQFLPEKSFEEIENMLTSAQNDIDSTLQIFRNIESPSPNLQTDIATIVKKAGTLSKNIANQRIFVDHYFKTPPNDRKKLFQVSVQK